jgi:hypothetical protein
MQQLLGTMRRLPLRCFHDCGDEVLVHHLDGKTSQKEARGMNPGTAIPIHRQPKVVQKVFSGGELAHFTPRLPHG